MKRHGIRPDWSAKSLAFHTQAVLQSVFILAKAKNGPTIAADAAVVHGLHHFVPEPADHPCGATWMRVAARSAMTG